MQAAILAGAALAANTIDKDNDKDISNQVNITSSKPTYQLNTTSSKPTHHQIHKPRSWKQGQRRIKRK